MLLASKHEEIYPPEIKDFVHVTDKAYTKQEILNMEVSALNTLGFQLTSPSPLAFLQRMVKLQDETGYQESQIKTARRRCARSSRPPRRPRSRLCARSSRSPRSTVWRRWWRERVVPHVSGGCDAVRAADTRWTQRGGCSVLAVIPFRPFGSGGTLCAYSSNW